VVVAKALCEVAEDAKAVELVVAAVDTATTKGRCDTNSTLATHVLIINKVDLLRNEDATTISNPSADAVNPMVLDATTVRHLVEVATLLLDVDVDVDSAHVDTLPEVAMLPTLQHAVDAHLEDPRMPLVLSRTVTQFNRTITQFSRSPTKPAWETTNNPMLMNRNRTRTPTPLNLKRIGLTKCTVLNMTKKRMSPAAVTTDRISQPSRATK